jgi:mRNA-degrading endonuclease RelE of RelBE toxin-antitoxin system
MKVITTAPVDIALRTLGIEDQRRVLAWIGHLKNWEGDQFVQEHSYKLKPSENTYVLHTSTDIRIFFTLEDNTITVLDVAKRPGILTSGSIAGGDGS